MNNLIIALPSGNIPKISRVRLYQTSTDKYKEETTLVVILKEALHYITGIGYRLENLHIQDS